MENNPQSKQEITRLNEAQVDYISELASRTMYRHNFGVNEETGDAGISCGGLPPLDMLNNSAPTIPEIHDGISFRGFEVDTFYDSVWNSALEDNVEDLEISINIPKKVFGLIVKFQKNKQEFSQLYLITDFDSRNILIENSSSNQEAIRLILNKKIWTGLCNLPIDQGQTLEDVVEKNRKDNEVQRKNLEELQKSSQGLPLKYE